MHILVADDQLRSALQAASVWGWGRRAGCLNIHLFERLAEQRKQDATQETEPDRLVRAIELLQARANLVAGSERDRACSTAPHHSGVEKCIGCTLAGQELSLMEPLVPHDVWMLGSS